MNREDIIRMAQEVRISIRAHYDETGSTPQELERFAALVAAAEREKVAAWMIQRSYATGHGDTTEDLLVELEWQVRESEREACAKVCDETLAQHYMKQTIPERDEALFLAVCADCAAAIRARGETK